MNISAKVEVAKPFGVIKKRPEDFIVKEVVHGQVIEPVFETAIYDASGKYTQFLMTKRNIPADPAYREIARQLGVKRSAISSHGKKDAVAVTAQAIVVEGAYQPTFNHDRIWLQQKGKAFNRLRLGGQEGNHFSIFVQTDALTAPDTNVFRNFFGPQRFGDGRVEVGRLLLEAKYDLASKVLLGSMNGRYLRNIMKRNSISSFDAMFHHNFARDLGWKVQQWQSHLWNKAATETKETSLPMWMPTSAKHYQKWWSPERVEDRVLKYAHNFTRDVWVTVSDHQTRKVPGGFVHDFTIRSGAYATEFLKCLYDYTDASREKYR